MEMIKTSRISASIRTDSGYQIIGLSYTGSERLLTARVAIETRSVSAGENDPSASRYPRSLRFAQPRSASISRRPI